MVAVLVQRGNAGDDFSILHMNHSGNFSDKQTAVVQQSGQKFLFTQNFSMLEMLLEELSSGSLQEELELQCGLMLDEKDMHQYFTALGLQDYVALHEQFASLREKHGKTNDLPDSALLDYAQKFNELEKKRLEILARADKLLDGKLNINAGYKKIIDDCWNNFLVLIKKSRGEKLERFFDEDVDPQDSTEVTATHSAIEMLASRYNSLLPFTAGQLKAQLSQQAGLYQRALEYVNIIQNTLKSALSDYPYFELRGFVDAQKIIGLRAEDALALLKNYRTAREALSRGTLATTLDHLILTPTEIRVGGYIPASEKKQELVYISVPHAGKSIAEGIINLYGNK